MVCGRLTVAAEPRGFASPARVCVNEAQNGLGHKAAGIGEPEPNPTSVAMLQRFDSVHRLEKAHHPRSETLGIRAVAVFT